MNNKSGIGGGAGIRVAALACVVTGLGWIVFAEHALGADRQFLVILATSPKQFANNNGLPPGGLPAPEAVRKRYFSDDDSFAAYWEEISYGAVTVSGDVTGWVTLPWAIELQTNLDFDTNPTSFFFDLDQSLAYSYGRSERILNANAMIATDFDGGGPGVPVRLGLGSFHFTSVGDVVWKPGERFVDMDLDGAWDSLDEANNELDMDGDKVVDLLGPWTDLNDDGVADLDSDCIYLQDWDNDGNPNCCPDGPFTAQGFAQPSCQCSPTKWTAGGDVEVFDCNGNTVPDICEVCNPNPNADVTTFCRDLGWEGQVPADGPNCLDDRNPQNGAQDAPDGIPDVCQFEDAGAPCSDSQSPLCVPLPTINFGPRCEYFDDNEDNSLDIVEPFENFMRRWDPFSGWVPIITDAAHPAFDAYIQNNYPARPDDVNALMEESVGRVVFGAHDPLDRLLAFNACKCPDGIPCRGLPTARRDAIKEMYGLDDSDLPSDFNTSTYCVVVQTCSVDGEECAPGFTCELLAGEDRGYCNNGLCGADDEGCQFQPVLHHEFNSPDEWEDVVVGANVNNDASAAQRSSTKLQQTDFVDLFNTTPKPAWFDQAWRNRYPTTAPTQGVPVWNPVDDFPFVVEAIPVLAPYDVTDAEPDESLLPRRFATRRNFAANAGGRNGNGTGWVDCRNDFDAVVAFRTLDGQNPDPISFEELCDAPILPEEQNGVGGPSIFFDGWVEHDDVPSSKYHRAGDQRLGEVTSFEGTNYYGQDRGRGVPGSQSNPDTRIDAAGPLATGVHGTDGFDAGNVLSFELLTWRNRPPFNDGVAWEYEHGVNTGQEQFPGSAFHPYAGPSGVNLGFRDYNLDGLIDQGETRFPGTENYITDAHRIGAPGVDSVYPFNRVRLLEDCIEALDHLMDFDDFLDPDALQARECSHGFAERARVPEQYDVSGSPNSITPAGLLSGTVLLAPGSMDPNAFFVFPGFVPIHMEDVRDLATPQRSFPFDPGDVQAEHINWNLFVQTSVVEISAAATNFQVVRAAEDLLFAWEDFPDLTDQDSGFGAIRNTPLGNWEIMAEGGLVHSIPILKERPCTRWIEPIDLTTILTPGVEASVTIPPYEAVRDGSAYFLENEDRLGERYYFYSVGGAGNFDPDRMPGAGMLVLHTDVGSNPDVLPPGQTDPTRFNYVIVQADGEGELEAGLCEANGVCGDDGDPWPGVSLPAKTKLNFNTVPSASWYALNAWTGIDISNISGDGNGSTLLSITWTPTNLPSLSFVAPPGGTSLNGIFRVLMDVTDVFGGTDVEVYYTTDPNDITITPGSGGNLAGSVSKSSSGTSRLTVDWNIRSPNILPDGRYFLFAKLIPGTGADGTERTFNTPRPNRNNVGDGMVSLSTCEVGGDPCATRNDCPSGSCVPSAGAVNIAGNKVRLETWVARVVMDDATSSPHWLITSSLSQPIPTACSGNSSISCNSALDCPAGQACVEQAPPSCMSAPLVGGTQQYMSCDGDVTFFITQCVQGSGSNPSWCPVDAQLFVPDDFWSFTTTGITAVSRSVTLENGEIREDPQPIIIASPLALDPGETVSFDARLSTDPNGLLLTFDWDFGDGKTADGERVQHTYDIAGTFTVTLKATNSDNRFGEAAVDIEVINNKPSAQIAATPVSGPVPLKISFSSTGSSDKETENVDLVYQWDFGDGQSANQEGNAGILRSPRHTYDVDLDNPACNEDCGCTYLAILTVMDADGATDTATIQIQAGNTIPEPEISTSRLDGPSPHTVTFNAENTTDPEEDQTLEVTWDFGDGETQTLPLGGADGSGDVSHTFVRRAEDDGASTFTVTVIISDGCATADPKRFTVLATEGLEESSKPRATFTINPENPLPGEEFKVDASQSRDRPDASAPLRFEWNWGDGSSTLVAADGTTPQECSSGSAKPCEIAAHVYEEAGIFLITLTVFDNEDPPNQDATAREVTVGDAGDEGTDIRQNQRPTAVICVNRTTDTCVNRTEGTAGVTEFIFDARDSSDPDAGDTLTFMWDFRDRPETGPVVARVFADSGVQTVTLTVIDQSGARDDTRLTIDIKTVGENGPPVAAIGTGMRTGSAPLTLKFDGQASFDPDGDPLTYRWEITLNGVLQDALDGPVVEYTFRDEGVYAVVLEVSDGVGAPVQTDPEIVRVTARAVPPDNGNDNTTDPGTGREINRDSADQRPGALCGMGMIGSVLGMLMGLSALRMSRRRRD